MNVDHFVAKWKGSTLRPVVPPLAVDIGSAVFLFLWNSTWNQKIAE